eukprot:TRINITY_DN816_c0_g1_i3.p1 TRINITY_DN816_c0_g1~~TRINITY_DN816_c0_g1_i3.p1  ORF type:complete len:325 (-),score=144.90 TRINITY_DN816_c0_g1_i3:26-1000(-)
MYAGVSLHTLAARRRVVLASLSNSSNVRPLFRRDFDRGQLGSDVDDAGEQVWQLGARGDDVLAYHRYTTVDALFPDLLSRVDLEAAQRAASAAPLNSTAAASSAGAALADSATAAAAAATADAAAAASTDADSGGSGRGQRARSVRQKRSRNTSPAPSDKRGRHDSGVSGDSAVGASNGASDGAESAAASHLPTLASLSPPQRAVAEFLFDCSDRAASVADISEALQRAQLVQGSRTECRRLTEQVLALDDASTPNGSFVTRATTSDKIILQRHLVDAIAALVAAEDAAAMAAAMAAADAAIANNASAVATTTAAATAVAAVDQ